MGVLGPPQQCREAWTALTHPPILCSTWQMASPEVQEARLESQRSRKQASTPAVMGAFIHQTAEKCLPVLPGFPLKCS